MSIKFSRRTLKNKNISSDEYKHYFTIIVYHAHGRVLNGLKWSEIDNLVGVLTVGYPSICKIWTSAISFGLIRTFSGSLTASYWQISFKHCKTRSFLASWHILLVLGVSLLFLGVSLLASARISIHPLGLPPWWE